MTIGRRRLTSVYTDAGDTLTFAVRATPLGETAGVAPAGPGDWLDEAKCATDDGRLAWLFDDEREGDHVISENFPGLDGRELRHDNAKAICETCPVIQQCRQAVRPGDRGIRAGVLLPDPQNRKESAA